MGFVGQDIPRFDGMDKATGRAKYVDDIDIPGMWHGAVVRSSIPYGRIREVKLKDSFDWSQVVTADARDIPGENCVAMIERDVPLIADKVTKHIGEAIMLIAAPTRELALEARMHVEVTYEELTPVLSIDESKAAKIKIHNDDNVVSHYTIEKGDMKKGFDEADVVVEGTYTMGHQEHMYIETQGMIAIPREAGGGFDIIGSIQCPYYVSNAISITMGMPQEKFSIRQSTVGGAFGGKEDYPSILTGYCTVLAHKAKRPIKIIYDRDEDTECTTKRHPARVKHKTGVKKDGTITAMEIEVEFDAGAYVTLTPVVLSRGVIHSAGPYRCENVFIDGTAYATNTIPNGAFRGFGAPQTCFPLEVHIDRVAKKIGMTPYEFRKKNMFHEGDRTATGQILDNSIATEEVFKQATTRSDFKKKYEEFNSDDGNVKRGMGMSFFFHGGAFTGSGEAKMKSEAGLRLDPNGKITVLTACTDMGQGAHTVLPQMVADHLGVDISCIDVETPDTALVPNSGPTVASRTTMIMGVVLGKCAKTLREKLLSFAVKKLDADENDLSFSDIHVLQAGKSAYLIADLVKDYLSENGPLEVIEHYELPPGINWDEKKHRGDAYPTYSWACDIAEVEVDMDTFEYRVKKMWLAQDIGKAINPKMAEGQIEGGTLQSLGYAQMEKHDVVGGAFRTNRFQTYIIPTFKDAPEMETVIVEKPYAHGPMGAKGIGEMPMNGGAPAIVNALAHATGLDICDLPATPEKLFEIWKSR